MHPRRLWSVGFQSTPSARRATCRSRSSPRSTPHFNPRPPRGERPVHAADTAGSSYFNPRPPRGERPTVIAANNQLHEFQSTPSARRATVRCKNLILGQQISIHALREEGDTATTRTIIATSYFNPRPPRGGRPVCPVVSCRSILFQSTPSARRATSIGASSSDKAARFQSTPSARRATGRGRDFDGLGVVISIHALREEGDVRQIAGIAYAHRFQSTPSARRAT